MYADLSCITNVTMATCTCAVPAKDAHSYTRWFLGTATSTQLCTKNMIQLSQAPPCAPPAPSSSGACGPNITALGAFLYHLFLFFEFRPKFSFIFFLFVFARIRQVLVLGSVKASCHHQVYPTKIIDAAAIVKPCMFYDQGYVKIHM